MKINLYSIFPDPNSSNSLEENHRLQISAAKQKLSKFATQVRILCHRNTIDHRDHRLTQTTSHNQIRKREKKRTSHVMIK